MSLCNMLYKIISELIANRLRAGLSKGISKKQFGFLHQQQIFDAIGVASTKIKHCKSLVMKN